MHVVGGIHCGVEPGRPARREIGLVGGDGGLVARRAGGEIAGVGLDMGRHMQKMPGMAGARREALGRRLRPRRVGRGFERMDQQMVGADMIRRAFQHGAQFRDHRLRSGCRLAVRLPPAPGTEIEHRLRMQHPGVEILGVFLGERRHRLRIGEVERCAFGGGILAIARFERGNVVALPLRAVPGTRLRLAQS